jgi:hypothetical protein
MADVAHRRFRGNLSVKIVADHIRKLWPFAEPVGVGRPGSDITGTPIDWEVKARRGANIGALMRQLEARAKEGVLAVGVMRLDGMGPKTVGRWPVIITLDDFLALASAAGYTAPPKDAA